MDPVRIMLLTDDETRKCRWQEVLAQNAAHYLVADDRDSERVDLVITDHPISSDELAVLSRQPAGDAVGVIHVGTTESADVVLPVDHSERELRLSCELLAQSVRLRRERNGLQERERLLTQLAYSDPLTGLPNRRAWDREVPIRFQAALQSQQPFCLAVLDLDNFKQLNDRWGHQAGDDVLRSVGRKLAEGMLPEQGYVARLGGDEFGYVVCGLPLEEAAKRVEEVRIALAYQSSESRGEFTTASAGVANNESLPASKWQDVLSAADDALRQAKARGRNQTVQAI